MFLKKRLDIIASYHDLRTEVRKLSTVVSSIQGPRVPSKFSRTNWRKPQCAEALNPRVLTLDILLLTKWTVAMYRTNLSVFRLEDINGCDLRHIGCHGPTDSPSRAVLDIIAYWA